MKARHTPLISAVIISGFDETELPILRRCADRCGYRVITAAEDTGSATVKSILAGFPDSPGTPLKNERFLIINGGGANASRLIDILRAEGITVPLKAMVTLYNQEWQLNALIDELISEHKEITEREGAPT